MRKTPLIMMCLTLLAAGAWAQSGVVRKTPDRPAAQKSSVQKSAAQKSSVQKSAAQKSSAQKSAAQKPVAQKLAARNQVTYKLAAAALSEPAAAPAMETPMGREELSIAQRVHHGHLPCELGSSVRVEPDQSQPGYFNVHGKGFRFRMHPVATSTGAIRLEDRQAGAVWLQLANKSMLMDQNKGQRLADECANPEQMAYAAQMKTTPPPALFDTSGMGR